MDKPTSQALIAQAILKTGSPNLLIDGKFGTHMRKVYDTSSGDLRAMVDRALKEQGTDVNTLTQFFSQLAEARKSVSKADGGSWVVYSDAMAYVRRFSQLLGMPDIADQIMGFLDIEAAKKVENGVKFYNARSVSPNKQYLGLFQMGQAAWTDAQGFINKKNGGYKLPDFSAGAFEAEANVAAGVAYSILNASRLKKGGFPVTANTLYGAHNQGPTGFMSYVKRGTLAAPNQSPKALKVLANARDESVAFV